MKKIISVLLCAAMLSGLCACMVKETESPEQPVLFYYPKTEFDYGKDPGVFGSEVRESKYYQNYNDDLLPLLQAYLAGPERSEFRNPFPEDLIMVNYKWESQMLVIILSSDLSALDDLDLMLACSSLALTCFGLTDADAVRIISNSAHRDQSKSVTLYRDKLLLTDESAAITETNSQ